MVWLRTTPTFEVLHWKIATEDVAYMLIFFRKSKWIELD